MSNIQSCGEMIKQWNSDSSLCVAGLKWDNQVSLPSRVEHYWLLPWQAKCVHNVKIHLKKTILLYYMSTFFVHHFILLRFHGNHITGEFVMATTSAHTVGYSYTYGRADQPYGPMNCINLWIIFYPRVRNKQTITYLIWQIQIWRKFTFIRSSCNWCHYCLKMRNAHVHRGGEQLTLSLDSFLVVEWVCSLVPHRAVPPRQIDMEC